MFIMISLEYVWGLEIFTWLFFQFITELWELLMFYIWICILYFIRFVLCKNVYFILLQCYWDRYEPSLWNVIVIYNVSVTFFRSPDTSSQCLDAISLGTRLVALSWPSLFFKINFFYFFLKWNKYFS